MAGNTDANNNKNNLVDVLPFLIGIHQQFSKLKSFHKNQLEKL